ncbi:MAG: ABC transporter substrate-binding protein [Bacteroidales bacterium]|jgi:LysM repeat protein|nr:ABC transporter substrate-binding protein [Bacteroidales bacterium]
MKYKILCLICCFVLLSINTVVGQTNDDITYGWHSVTAGENLYRISRNYFLKEADIIEINPGLSAENLKVGQKIKIPITIRNKKLLITESKITKRNIEQDTKLQTSILKKSYPKNKHLNIAMFLPLYYDKISEMGFDNFNINEKRKKEYKSFEYITFYEGARIALDRLEKAGYNVSLYVYDIGENDVDEMKRVLNNKEMREMNLLIPLLLKQPFEVCAEFAQKTKIPIINPMSQNLAILNNNQVFKIQPSAATEVETTIRYIRSHFDNPNITLIHSNTSEEKPIVAYYKQLFEKDNISWTIIDYNKFANRITEKVVKGKQNIVISLVRQTNGTQNESYIKDLLGKLSNKKENNITLFGPYEWLDLTFMDFSLLQQFNFHFLLSYLNDYTNANFVDFVKEYRKHFKNEPDKIYASLGYDIIAYFIPALIDGGDDFINEPNTVKVLKMIHPFYFERRNENTGYQNKRTSVYQIKNYKIVSAID